MGVDSVTGLDQILMSFFVLRAIQIEVHIICVVTKIIAYLYNSFPCTYSDSVFPAKRIYNINIT
jgi:hypothetical protein